MPASVPTKLPPNLPTYLTTYPQMWKREDRNVLYCRPFSNRLTLVCAGCVASEGTTCMVREASLCAEDSRVMVVENLNKDTMP